MPLAILDERRAGEASQPLIGPPDVLVDLLRQYRDAGLEHVILSPYYGLDPAMLPRDLAEVERILVRFTREIRPRV